MTVYCVNSKYYVRTLSQAVQRAKEVIIERMYDNICVNQYTWKVTKGKNDGYCVIWLGPWENVGNSNYCRVTIRKINVEQGLTNSAPCAIIMSRGEINGSTLF